MISLDFRESLKALYGPEAIGGEMEGTGLYVSAHDAKVDWIVVKAICDWADGHKAQDKEKRQALAATNAAQVLKAALDEGNLYGGDGPTETGAGTSHAVPAPRKHHPPAARFMGLRDLHDLPVHLLEERSIAAEISLRKDLSAELQPDTQASMCWNICWLGRAIPKRRRCSRCSANTAWARPSPVSGWRWHWRSNGRRT